MANSMKLVLTFKCTDGEKRNFSWNYANELPRTADVKSLAQVMITNGSIFQNVPAEILEAKVVVTTENGIDIND